MEILLNDKLIVDCGSENYKIAIAAQVRFVKVIKQSVQDAIDIETNAEKDDNITKISDNIFSNFVDIGSSAIVPSEVFTNLRYDKIDEMLIHFKNNICQRLKDKKILYYGDIKIWCDDCTHKQKQVGIYGWCDGTTIDPRTDAVDKFNQFLQSK